MPPKAVALPLVLFIIILIAALSMGYLSRSDLELACGRNMVLRMQMDSLAESGLEHARGLILRPQDALGAYWTGSARLQLVPESNDYYDVNVSQSGECNYQIVSTAYRLESGETVGRAGLEAELRLDPCIAYWQGNSAEIPVQASVTGDVFCGGKLLVAGIVDGDVFAVRSIDVSGSVSGQKRAFVDAAPVASAGLSLIRFESHYHIEDNLCQVGVVDTEVLFDGVTLQPAAANPAGVYYRDGTLHLKGHVEIYGMLVVRHDLILEDGGDVTIRAVKNFPALLVGQGVKMEGNGRHLRIEGLAQIGHGIDMGNGVGNTIEIIGALCMEGGAVENTTGGTLRLVAAPNKAAIQLWPEAGVPVRWSPAAGAFFKSIKRH